MILAALALAAPAALLPVHEDPVVLSVDGEEIRRSEYGDWLLRVRGEVLAPLFARLWRLRRLADEEECRPPAGIPRMLANSEIQRRIGSAFGGDRARWEAELAREGRTAEGLLAERALEKEGELLLEALAARRGIDTTGLVAELDGSLALARDGSLTIDDVRVGRADFLAWLFPFRGELNAKRFAEDRLIRHAAVAAEVAVTAEEVQARIDATIERSIDLFHEGDRDVWRTALAADGRTEERYRRELAVRAELDLLVAKLVRKERAPTEEDLRRAWRSAHGVDGRRIELRWIRIDAQSPEPDPERTQEEDEELIEAAHAAARTLAADLRRRLDEGQDFATLAERYSDDERTRARGGRPAEGFRPSQLPEPLGDVVRSLAAGAISDPIEHFHSVWIFEVTAIRVSVFEDVRDELRAELLARPPTDVEIASRKNLLTRNAVIVIHPPMSLE